MSSAGAVVMGVVVVSLTVAAGGGWWLLRRRPRALPVPSQAEFWEDESTLYTTYEDLGISGPRSASADPGSGGAGEDATAFLDMGELALSDADGAGGRPAAGPDATAFLDMGEFARSDADGAGGRPAAGANATAFLDMGEFVRSDEVPGGADPEPVGGGTAATEFIDMGEFARATPEGSVLIQPIAQIVAAPHTIPPDEGPRQIEQAWAPPPPPAYDPPAAPPPSLSLAPPPAFEAGPAAFEAPPAFEAGPAFEPARAGAGLGVGAGDLASYLDAAVACFVDWREAMFGPRDLDAVADGPERAWIDAMELLKTGNVEARDALLLPALRHPIHDGQRTVAALALLERRELELSKLLADHSLDELYEALSLWRGPSAEATLRRVALAQFPQQATSWARLLSGRGMDPGAELLARYLEADKPAHVAAGFDLLAVHDDRGAHHGAVMASMFEPNPVLRTAAIEAGLRLRVDVAWVHCRQLAMASDRSRTCELVASLSSAKEQAKLISWASRSSAPAHGLWCAALTGRVAAVELALGQLDTRPVVARRCLTHLTGAGEEVDGRWWQANGERFTDDGRWLSGARHDLGAVRRGLAQLGPEHRLALALELSVRRPALRALPLTGFAHELRRALADLDDVEVDFEGGYPWTSG